MTMPPRALPCVMDDEKASTEVRLIALRLLKSAAQRRVL